MKKIKKSGVERRFEKFLEGIDEVGISRSMREYMDSNSKYGDVDFFKAMDNLKRKPEVKPVDKQDSTTE